MLVDIERKVLRIIVNYSSGQGQTPTIHELSIKTGRTEAGIKKVLQALNDEQYISWEECFPDIIRVLEAWERKEYKW